MGPKTHSKIFGRDLREAYQSNGRIVPAICTESLQLLQQGVSNPKLFRGESDSRKVQLLQKAWDQGRNPLRLAKIHDYCAVSDCLLNWLKSLPSPVIPCKLFHAFLHVHHTCSHSQWVYQLQVLFEKLEPWESETIVPILSFLHEYEHVHKGKELRNPSLGHIFGPSLLKAHNQALPLPYPEDVKAAASLIDCVISDFDLIFRPPQSPCSSPVKKPPSRAKISPPRKDLSSWREEAASLEEKRKQFGAKMVCFDIAPKQHLRVNVNPLPTIQDENCEPVKKRRNSNESRLAQILRDESFGSSQANTAQANTAQEVLDNSSTQGEDTELDMVVGDLLCGSLSGMLFEPDDQKFLDRTTSIISTSSPSISCYQSEISTDLSSDEEMVQFCHELKT